MRRSSSTRWAVGTVAVVAIALSLDSLRRTRADFDAMRAPQRAIRGQLEAFNREDYRAAYRFAAPEIQEMYSLPDFQHMVQEGFPQIAHSRQFSFGSSEVRDDTVAVPVAVTGKDGVLVHVVYWMRHEQGGWRVAGVERDHVPGGPPSRSRPAPSEHAPKREETRSAGRSTVDG